MLYQVKLHSIVDVITNSSTEIFKSAVDSGVESIEALIRAQIEAFGLDLDVRDIIKPIVITSNDDDVTTSIFLLYQTFILNNGEYFKETVHSVVDGYSFGGVTGSEIGSLVELEEFTKGLHAKIGLSDFLYLREFRCSNFVEAAVELCMTDAEFNSFHKNVLEYVVDKASYDYTHETVYNIIPTSDKYIKLVEAIKDCLSVYSLEAHYC